MLKNITAAHHICFMIDEDVLRSIVQMFQRHALRFVTLVNTVDNVEHRFGGSDEFFDWIKQPHSPIESITFSTLPADGDRQAVVLFRNPKRSFFLGDPDFGTTSAGWIIDGDHQFVREFEEPLLVTANTIRRPLSWVFGSGARQTIAFNIGVFLLFIAFAGTMWVWWLSAHINAVPANMELRLPNGQIAHLVPLMPVEQAPQPSNTLTHLFPFACLIAAVLLLIIRYLYPVGVFKIGYDKLISPSRLDISAPTLLGIIWSIVVGLLVAVIYDVIK